MRGAVLLTAFAASLFAAVQTAQTATQQGTNAGHEAKRCGVLASRSAAPSFDCYRAGTNVTFYCANGAKAYWAERLTATTAAHPGHGPVRVDVGAGTFRPADIRIGTGDTVLWVWSGPDLDHTVTASAAATPTR